MIRRPDLLDHLAPFATPNAAGALTCLVFLAAAIASVAQLARFAPVGP